MSSTTPPGVRVLEPDHIPSVGELYRQQLPEMTAAETKEEAYEAIEPLVYLAGLLELKPIFRELSVGGPVPERVAAFTPLTEDEVKREIACATWWWVGLRAEAHASD